MLRLASLGLLLLGCATADPTAPSSLEYNDLALAVGSTVATPSGGGELGAFGDVVALAHGRLPTGFTASADGTITGTHAGLGYRYALVCRDVQGATGACDGATDAVAAQVSWTGGLDLPDTGMQLDRTGMWALSGLTRGVATASGTATLAYASRIANRDRGTESTYRLAYAATYTDVAYDTVALHAMAGDLHYALVVTRTATGSAPSDHAVDASLALLGDGTATIDLDGAQRYTLDLATGAVVRI